MIESVSLLVPNTIGDFGASQPTIGLAGRKTLQLTGGVSDGAELWISVDGINFTKFQAFTGTGAFPAVEVYCKAARAKRTAGSATGLLLLIGASPDGEGSAGPQDFVYRGDNAAADVLAESPIFTVVGNRTLSKISLVAAGALAQHGTDNFTITYRARDSTGTLIGVVGIFTTATTALVAQTSGANLVPLSITNLPDGTIITFQVAKGGAGQLLPITSHTFAYS